MLWAAAALMLVFEGLLPFLSPGTWRAVFARALAMSDGQIRFIGLLSIGAGMLLLAIAAVWNAATSESAAVGGTADTMPF